MKKRILSLILALSMVLSVLPLGAFAAGSTQDLVIGSDGYPVGSEGGSKDCNGGGNGNDWEYYSKSRILCLNGGTFDLSTTEPVKCEIHSFAIITGGTFNGAVYNLTETISGGIFNGTVTNDPTGKISGGTFQSTGSVENKGTITGNGTFNGTVTNNNTISGGTFQSTSSVTNYGTINGNGTFNGEVTNYGNIKDGTFEGTVKNYSGGTISGGTFAGSVQNMWDISGGVFNGNATLTNVTGGHNITWDAASPDAKIVEVNGVPAEWEPYVVVTQWTASTAKEVTIKANTEIFSLNGQPIAESNYGVDKKTVKFTMSNENVVLGTGDLVMAGGYPDCPDDTKGNGWEYRNGKLTLTRNSGTFDFSSTHPQGKTPGTPTTTPVACVIEISSGVEITGGTFAGSVTNNGTIKDNGIFEGKVTNNTSGTILGGTFRGEVDNSGAIEKGTFEGSVQNNNRISGGTFQNGCSVTNWSTISGGTFQNTCSVTNHGYIKDGTFAGEVTNDDGTIYGGIFAGSVENNWRIYGGVFNGKTGLNGVTGLLSITWDAAYPNAKITEVNGVSADWKPYVVVTSYATTNEVIITADTEIFSLNGRLLGEGDHVNGNKNTVKFTELGILGDEVVLNGAITCTDLVMEKGRPEASNEGKISCSGTGWSYDHSTDTLTLTSNSGTYDFSLANPQDTTKTTSADSAVACAIVIESGAEITGGTFEKKVTNNAGGMISGGTFQETCSVTNNGTIKNGTFKDVCSVTNEGTNATIENGTFKNMCRVINNSTIKNGTFKNKCSVENNNTIENGTFAGSVTNSGTVTGGVFNGNATLINVTGGHNITWDAASSKAKIEKVNGVSANWAPYVVTSNATTKEVTITADTEIFSLNGQPIGAGNCNSSYGSDRTTVTFTMPDDDVVLNEEINYGDLVMENGWPKDSNGGKTPCKGDGWEYIPNDPTNGNMLLLTGSNQTGGLFDFSTIGDRSAVECNVFVGKPTAITGGEFNGKVFNNSGILGGTFHGEVDNTTMGRIENGTFENSVENNGMIENGAFHDEVKNNGTINDGTFRGKVDNSGTITGGIFAAGLSMNTGTVTGGIFNGKTALTDARHVTVTDGSVSQVNGEDPLNADGTTGTAWDLYSYKDTTMTITANTEIFSLNGQPIGAVNCNSSYGVDKKTVTFTMPDDDVVLNGELITKPEPEPEPEPTTYTVTVIGGTIDGKTSVSAKEKDTLTVVLDQSEIPDGMTFDMWSISSSKLSGDINVDYRAEAMTFQMPAEDVTIRAQYRSAEIIEDAAPSPLATAATIAVGGAAAGIVVWQGVNLGVDLYLANALPQGVPVPTDRRALALLLWETAGKPEVALPTLYGDIPAEEIELQKATHWAVQNGLMDAADKKDASFFDPDHYVTKMDVFGAWLRLKKLLGTIGTSPTQ